MSQAISKGSIATAVLVVVTVMLAGVGGAAAAPANASNATTTANASQVASAAASAASHAAGATSSTTAATTTTTTSAPTTTTTTTTANSSANGSITHNVDSNLGPVVLKSWTWHPGSKTMTLHLHAKVATRVKITDYGKSIQAMKSASGPGGHRDPGTGHNLMSGSNTITVHPFVTKSGGVYLGVGTTGDSYSIWTQGVGGSALPSASWAVVIAAVLAVFIGTSIVSYVVVSRRAADDSEIVEQLA